MTDLEKRTTSISTETHKPLIVEFKTHHPHVLQPEGSFKQVDDHVVALIAPEDDHRKGMYLIGMTPGTALNLLNWLQEHEELLRELAEEK